MCTASKVHEEVTYQPNGGGSDRKQEHMYLDRVKKDSILRADSGKSWGGQSVALHPIL